MTTAARWYRAAAASTQGAAARWYRLAASTVTPVSVSAGAALSVEAGSAVALRGTDDAQTSAVRSWEQTTGAPVALQVNGPAATFTAPVGLNDVQLSFRYTVTQNGVPTSSTVTVTVWKALIRLYTATGATPLVIRRGNTGPLPLSRRALFGISGLSTSSPPANGAFHAAEQLVGARFPVAGVFYSFDTVWSTPDPELEDFAQAPYLTAPAAGQTAARVLHVCWQPNKTSGAVLMTDIVAGVWNAHIDQMLAGMRAYPGPVVCRWGHEMNGNWYPWAAAYGNWGGASPKANPGCFSTAEYIAAWRYIVNRARAQNSTNVQWYWCTAQGDASNGAGTTYPLEAYYPGDAYVDILGFDAYNDGAGGWRTPAEVCQPVYNRQVALNATKPQWIGEIGSREPTAGQLTSSGSPASKGEWITQLFDLPGFPNITSVNYFNVDKSNAGRFDWRFQTSPGSQAAAAAAYQGAARADALAAGAGTLPLT